MYGLQSAISVAAPTIGVPAITSRECLLMTRWSAVSAISRRPFAPWNQRKVMKIVAATWVSPYVSTAARQPAVTEVLRHEARGKRQEGDAHEQPDIGEEERAVNAVDDGHVGVMVDPYRAAIELTEKVSERRFL